MPPLIVNVINETGREKKRVDLVKTADETDRGRQDESRSSPSAAAR